MAFLGFTPFHSDYELDVVPEGALWSNVRFDGRMSKFCTFYFLKSNDLFIGVKRIENALFFFSHSIATTEENILDSIDLSGDYPDGGPAYFRFLYNNSTGVLTCTIQDGGAQEKTLALPKNAQGISQESSDNMKFRSIYELSYSVTYETESAASHERSFLRGIFSTLPLRYLPVVAFIGASFFLMVFLRKRELLAVCIVILLAELFLYLYYDDALQEIFQRQNLHMLNTVEYTTDYFDYNERHPETIELVSGLIPIPAKKCYPTRYPVSAEGNTRRVVCLGASATQGGLIEDWNNAYSGVLERVLNLDGHDLFEVINAGFPGSPMHFLLYYNQIVRRLKPELVVLYMDYVFLCEAREYALLDRIETCMRENKWISNVHLLKYALKFRHPYMYGVYGLKALYNSRFFSLLEIARYALSHPKESTGFSAPSHADLTRILTDNDSPLAEFLRVCKEENVKLLVISQYSWLMYENEQQELEDVRQRVNAYMQEEYEHVYFADCNDFFGPPDAAIRYFLDIVHFTEEGHHVMAESVYAEIQKQKLL